MKTRVLFLATLVLLAALFTSFAVFADGDEDGESLVDVGTLFPTIEVSFDAATEDEVTNMPATFKAVGPTYLPTTQPKRDGYMFLGWSLEEGGDIVNAVNVTEPVTLYANWVKVARLYTFGEGGTTEIVGSARVTGVKKADGYTEYHLEAGAHDQVRIAPTVNIDPKKSYTIIVRLAAEEYTANTQIYYRTEFLDEDGVLKPIGYVDKFEDGKQYAEALSVAKSTTGAGLKEPYNVYMDMKDRTNPNQVATLPGGAWADEATKNVLRIWVDPFKRGETTVRLFAIGIVEDEMAVYFDGNENNDVKATGIPYGFYGKAGSEITVTTDAVPEREGYLFKGWSLDPEATSGAMTLDTTVTIGDEDLYYYAVWENDATVPHTDTAVLGSDEEGYNLSTEGYALGDNAVMIAAGYNNDGRVVDVKVFAANTSYSISAEAATIRVYALDADLKPITSPEIVTLG